MQNDTIPEAIELDAADRRNLSSLLKMIEARCCACGNRSLALNLHSRRCPLSKHAAGIRRLGGLIQGH